MIDQTALAAAAPAHSWPAPSPRIVDRLWCHWCGGQLQVGPQGAECACGARYPRTARGTLDLRPRRSKKYPLEFQVGTDLPVDSSLRFEPLQPNEAAEVDFTGARVPHHMTRPLMSYFPRAASQDSLMLDLGCGNGVHREICELAGFEWVGVDYDPDSDASLLADAHALPFEEASFEFVLSIATLHLLRYPHVVLQEIRRVLQPGGVFVGTVAFLEPFHDGGFYHHTHLGILNSLQSAGFEVQRVAPSLEWSALNAQAQMALFPRMPPLLSRSIVYPTQLLHKLWWKVGSAVTHNPNATEAVRVRNTTGAFAFVARAAGGRSKPA